MNSERLDKNCWDQACAHCDSDLDVLTCKRKFMPFAEEVSEFLKDCPYFEPARTCLNCSHAQQTVYETGTIDSVDYSCPFMDNAVIYSDTRPFATHYYDIPLCPAGRFERKSDD